MNRIYNECNCKIIDTLENKIEKLIIKIKIYKKQSKFKIELIKSATSYKLNQMRLKR
jgi:hypothetical protein